jgi:chemotaxis protein histidine kinase CheA
MTRETPSLGIANEKPRTASADLRALYEQIITQKLDLDPKSYNHPEERFLESDTLRGIVEKCFSIGGRQINPSFVDRTALALEIEGADIKKNAPDSWQIEHGRLILKKAGAVIVDINILPWKELRETHTENEPLDTTQTHLQLIKIYTDMGSGKFIEEIKKIQEKNPTEADEALLQVFEHLGKTDPIMAINLMNEIAKQYAPDMKNMIDQHFNQAIESETNTENKKVLELMKLLTEIKHKGDYPDQDVSGTENYMNQILEKISQIDATKVDGELKEYYESTRKFIEIRLRQSMAMDIVEITKSTLDSSLLDLTKKDVTFVNSLDELKRMPTSELAKSLRNEGLSNMLDSDAEVYLASQHVIEAMRLYLTYLYPQVTAKGEVIQNPLSWALEQVKKGQSIKLPEGFRSDPSVDVINDVYKTTKPIVGNEIKVDELFIAKDAELRLFDEYQKGEERIGETSIWNAAPTNWKEGALTGAVLGGGIASAPGALGGAIWGQISAMTGLGERLKTDNTAFLSDPGEKTSMMQGADSLFPKDLSGLMRENGSLGAARQLELQKIIYLRKTKNYDDARALAAKILFNKIKQPTEVELEYRAKKLDEKFRTKINAQVKLMIEKDERFAGKSYAELLTIINKSTEEALKDKAYLMVIDEKASRLRPENLSDFEKKALELLNIMNGHEGVPVADETVDIGLDVAKVVVEIAAIEIATAGLGSVAAGASGARLAAQWGARGLNLARGTRLTRAGYEAGEALAAGSGMAGRLTRMVARNRMVSGGTRWLMEGRTIGARATGNLLHATALVEGTHLMHGSTLQLIDDPQGAAWEVASMAATIWALGSTQRFLRGQSALPGSKIVSSIMPGTPILRQPAEIGMEVLALHHVSQAEKWASVSAGIRSQTEIDAMSNAVAWHEWAHSAGIIIGLRSWNMVQNRPVTARQKSPSKPARTPTNRPAETKAESKQEAKPESEPTQKTEPKTEPKHESKQEAQPKNSEIYSGISGRIRVRLENLRQLILDYKNLQPAYKKKINEYMEGLDSLFANFQKNNLTRQKVEQLFRHVFGIKDNIKLRAGKIGELIRQKLGNVDEGLKKIIDKLDATLERILFGGVSAKSGQQQREAGQKREEKQNEKTKKDARESQNDIKNNKLKDIKEGIENFEKLTPQKQKELCEKLEWLNTQKLSGEAYIIAFRKIFNINRDIVIDTTMLGKLQRKIARKHHPDRHMDSAHKDIYGNYLKQINTFLTSVKSHIESGYEYKAAA